MLKKIFLMVILSFGCAHKKPHQVVQDVTAGPLELSVFPGDIKEVKLKLNANEVVSELICSDKIIKFRQEENILWFYYGQNYFIENGESNCSAKINDQSKTLVKIKILSKKFGEESLRVSPKKVNLSKKDLKRSQEERIILDQIYQETITEPLFLRDFVPPMPSRLTSIYGTRRVFNQTRQGQHLGVDYKAAVGDEIFSSNSGKVILARNLFFSGNTVILDHGLGIVTTYLHLSKILVKEGDYVPQLFLLGLAGSTGRVTGPHLHWGVKVNGHWVDGQILLAMKND